MARDAVNYWIFRPQWLGVTAINQLLTVTVLILLLPMDRHT